MMWFFERSDSILELETRYGNETSEHVIEIRTPDAASETERFTDTEAFGHACSPSNVASAVGDGDEVGRQRSCWMAGSRFAVLPGQRDDASGRPVSM